jgi:hypothetical protein
MPKPEIRRNRGPRHRQRRRGGKRDSFSATGGVVSQCENVTVALQRRKGSNQVNMNVGKTSGRNGNRSGWGRNVVVHL